MNYGKNKAIFMDEYKKNELISNIILNCVEYAGDSYKDFGRNVLQILKDEKLVEYGEKSKDIFEVVKLSKYYAGKFGIFNNEQQKLLSCYDIPLTYSTIEEAQEIADEENEKYAEYCDLLKE